MADLTFKETCPCGDSIDVYGWTSAVEKQAEIWRRIHKPHMNKIAKAVEEEKLRPAVPPVVWPPNINGWPLIYPPEPGTTMRDWEVTFNTDLEKGVTTVDYHRVAPRQAIP